MTIELKVPAAGESISEVYIGEWTVQEGEWIGQDECVVELESDKATIPLNAPEAGTVTKILLQTGDQASVGQAVAMLEPGERPASSPSNKTAAAESGSERQEVAEPDQAADDQKQAQPSAGRETRQKTPSSVESAPEREPTTASHVMPAAARLLAEHDLEADDVQPSGPGGRLLKEDVQRHLREQSRPETPREPDSRDSERPAAAQREAADNGDATRQRKAVRMTPIRQRIAQRLVQSQQTAALLTTFNEIDMTAVIALRSRFKQSFAEKYGIKLGFMSFFVRAVVDGLSNVPQLNAQIEEDRIVYHNYCDIGIAVGGGKGLVVPVLRSAERMSFAQIEQSIDDFAHRAAANRIELDELQGGTFTISNGGIYGSLLSTPIINPPQSGVLGMHTIQERPVGVEGQIVLRPMMYVALTYDHRLVDGREAVTFLRRVKDVLEEPARLMLEV